MIVNYLLNLLGALIGKLGTKNISYLSCFLGILTFDIIRLRRGVILNNLDIAFKNEKTKEEKIQIGRNSTITFLNNVLEFFAARTVLPKMNIIVKNEEIMREALSHNLGVYALNIHLGHWDALCYVTSRKFNSPIHVVVKPISRGGVARWIENTRRFVGFLTIKRGGSVSPTKQIHEFLRKNQIVAFVVDQKRPSGEILPFFGQNASTNNSLAKIWSIQKAPIIPTVVRKIDYNTHEVTYLPEFIMTEDPLKTFEQNVTENTKNMNLLVEEIIRKNPNEYFWMHNRWEL